MNDDDKKVSTSDLAGRERSDTTTQRDDAPVNGAAPPRDSGVEDDRSAQRERLDRDRQDSESRSAGERDDALGRDTARGNGVRSERTALLEGDAAKTLNERWTEIQVDFVDKPREAVSRADELVASVMQQLAARFADERDNLESQWSSGDDVDTEELRVALQRYRSFFQRLLSA